MTRPKNTPHIIETTNSDHASEHSIKKGSESKMTHAKEAEHSINDNDTNHTYTFQEKSFEHTMADVRTDLSSTEQAFSRFIHIPIIEKTSDFIGSTILRPNAILCGGICALILVSVLYWLARYYGFALQGFETIGAFTIGWIIGIVFDIIHALLTKKY